MDYMQFNCPSKKIKLGYIIQNYCRDSVSYMYTEHILGREKKLWKSFYLIYMTNVKATR